MTGISGARALLKDMLLPCAPQEQTLGKYRTAAWIRFFLVYPLLYGFTLYCLLRAESSVDSSLYRSAVFVWIALAGLNVILNVWILLSRNTSHCGLLSMACIADELISNEVVVFLTGVVASHALIFIVIAVAVYRVYFDYRQGLFSAVFGAALHILTVILYFGGALPRPPVQFASGVIAGLPGLMAWASTASLAIGVLIAFTVLNFGMNRMQRLRKQLEDNWKKDLDSIERFNEQVMECTDESAVYAETIKAVRYATPYQMVALFEQACGTIQVKAAGGWNRKNVQAAWEDAGGRLPGNNEMVTIIDSFRHNQPIYCFSLECGTGSPVYLAVGGMDAGEPDAHRRSMLLNISQSAGDAVNTLRMLRQEKERGYRDGLTGLYNKRYLLEQLPMMLKSAEAAGKPLCAAMFDIDSFKSYNDTFGHLAGDDLLARVARTVAGTLRDEDIAARFGGEEFLVVFEDCDRAGGNSAAERIRAAVERLDDMNRCVSVSGGVAAYPDDASDCELLLECADKRLYRAKEAGKNQVFSN